MYDILDTKYLSIDKKYMRKCKVEIYYSANTQKFTESAKEREWWDWLRMISELYRALHMHCTAAVYGGTITEIRVVR